jgi:hypothetical protein
MSRTTATWIAWTMWCLTLGFALTHVTLNALTDPLLRDEITVGFLVAWSSALIAFQSFATVGAVLASRLPGNPIGWLFCLAGLVCQLANGGGAYVKFAYDHSLPGDVALSVALGGSWAVGSFLGVIVPLYLYPDGRPLTRRWRPVVVAAFVWPALFWVGSLFAPGRLELLPVRRNPLGIDVPLIGASVAAAPVLIVLAVVAVILRFRRSRGVEREQMRVLTFTTVFVLAVFWGIVALPLPPDVEVVGEAATLLLIALVPISMGVAILRYRLYEIDRIVSRTIVYALLTVVLGACYVGLVLGGQALFSSFAGGSNLAIAASTLVVAALFLPVRSRVQRIVDRRFNRRRYDAQRTLEAFGARLREQVELDALATELVGVVGETMQPAHAALWLRIEGTR